MNYKLLIKSLLINLVLLLCVNYVVILCLSLVPGGVHKNESLQSQSIVENLNNTKYESSQSFNILINTFTFNWGISSETLSPVKESIISSFSKSIILISFSFVLIILVSTILVAVSTIFKNSKWPEIINWLSVFSLSLPSLFIAPLLIYFFIFKLDLLPMRIEGGNFLSYILPIVCLSIRPISLSTRLIISDMEEQFKKDYVRQAKAKGLSWIQIVRKHIVKNSLTAFFGTYSTALIHLITGSFLIEYLFSIQGIGYLLRISLEHRDFNVVIPIIFVTSLLVRIIYWLNGLLFHIYEPRLEKVEI